MEFAWNADNVKCGVGNVLARCLAAAVLSTAILVPLNSVAGASSVCANALTADDCVGVSGPIHVALTDNAVTRQVGAPPAQADAESNSAAATASEPQLYYDANHGPVQRAPTIFVTYWGWPSALTSTESSYQATLNGFLGDVGGTPYLANDTQYYEISGGNKLYIGNPAGQLAGVWRDTTAIPSSPTQDDLANEAARSARHFGVSSAQAAYFIATPHGHNSADFNKSICAWHSWVANSNPRIAYVNLPYQFDGPNCQIYGAAGFAYGQITGIASHELAETQTDPIVLTAWHDTNNDEVGDKCSPTQQHAYAPSPRGVAMAHGTWVVQGLWSNRALTCVFQGVGPRRSVQV